LTVFIMAAERPTSPPIRRATLPRSGSGRLRSSITFRITAGRGGMAMLLIIFSASSVWISISIAAP
jgi:hypothetical protein